MEFQIKFLLIVLILFLEIIIQNVYENWLNDNYLNLQKKINIFFVKKLYNKIRIGINARIIRDGGIGRITSLLVNYFSKIKIFKIFLFTLQKLKKEFYLPKNIVRINNVPLYNNILIDKLNRCKIDVFIYQYCSISTIRSLNKLEKIKVIFFRHVSIFLWIYLHRFNEYKHLINEYKHSKYVINLVPLENDYNIFLSFQYLDKSKILKINYKEKGKKIMSLKFYE